MRFLLNRTLRPPTLHGGAAPLVSRGMLAVECALVRNAVEARDEARRAAPLREGGLATADPSEPCAECVLRLAEGDGIRFQTAAWPSICRSQPDVGGLEPARNP